MYTSYYYHYYFTQCVCVCVFYLCFSRHGDGISPIYCIRQSQWILLYGFYAPSTSAHRFPDGFER